MTIKKLTADCPREDCSITMGMSSTTCIGWTPTYDKHGNLTSHDLNVTTTTYSCSKCGQRWSVASRWGEEPHITKTGKLVTPPISLDSGSGFTTITTLTAGTVKTILKQGD